jgi:hypothetical protein
MGVLLYMDLFGFVVFELLIMGLLPFSKVSAVHAL